MDKSKIRRIIVITLNNTGDAILTTPVIEALLKEFPNVKFDIVAGPNGKEIFEKHKKISKIFVYNKHAAIFEKFRLAKKLRKMSYDLAVDLKNSALPFLIGARYKSRALGRKKTSLHKMYQHLSVIERMGIDTKEAKLNIETDAEDIENVEALLNDVKNKFVVMSCGAKSHTKRWPPSYFAALIDVIKNELGYEVILVGNEEGCFPDSDRVVIDSVKKIAKASPMDLVGKTNIRELAALIRKSSLLITNDSAPLHVASAVNTPAIAIFGPTDEKKYGPLADRSIVLRKHLKCRPCEKPQCRYDYECMKEISVPDAVKAVKEILGG